MPFVRPGSRAAQSWANLVGEFRWHEFVLECDMLGILVIAATFCLGFGAGYAVREQISRRRRRHLLQRAVTHPRSESM